MNVELHRVCGKGAYWTARAWRQSTLRALCMLGFPVAAIAISSPNAVAAAPTKAKSETELAKARALFTAAFASEEKGEFQAACEGFGKVFAIKESASVHYHLGVCEDKLGHLVSARDHYVAAKQLAIAEKKQDVLSAVEAPLLAVAIRIPTLRIEVVDYVHTTHIMLDGRTLARGDLGVALTVDPGRHSISWEADSATAGTPRNVSEITIHENEALVVRAALPTTHTSAAPLHPVDTDTSPTAASKPAAAPVVASPHAPASTDERAPSSKVPALVATGLTAVVLAGGFFAYVHAGSLADGARAQCPNKLVCDDERTSIRTWDALALGGFIAGASLAVVSLVLWTHSSPKAATTAWNRAPQRTAAAPPPWQLGFGPSGIALGGQFE